MATAVSTQIVVTESENAPEGIALTPVDTGEQGVRVQAVMGECFGRHIQWSARVAEYTAIVGADPATGLPMLSLRFASGFVSEHRGFEPATSTWWRYVEEADPAEYREHCVRIVRTL